VRQNVQVKVVNSASLRWRETRPGASIEPTSESPRYIQIGGMNSRFAAGCHHGAIRRRSTASRNVVRRPFPGTFSPSRAKNATPQSSRDSPSSFHQSPILTGAEGYRRSIVVHDRISKATEYRQIAAPPRGKAPLRNGEAGIHARSQRCSEITSGEFVEWETGCNSHRFSFKSTSLNEICPSDHGDGSPSASREKSVVPPCRSAFVPEAQCPSRRYIHAI